MDELVPETDGPDEEYEDDAGNRTAKFPTIIRTKEHGSIDL